MKSCTQCERTFTADDEVARAKAESYERARAETEQRQRRQLQEEARKEGMEAAHAASKLLVDAVLAENAGLKENMVTAVTEETALRVAAAAHAMELKYSSKAAQDFREKQDLLATIEKLKRAADGKSPNELGEIGEIDLFRELTAAFPEDKLNRIAKGTEGGDIEQIVMHNRRECGGILHERKNTKTWNDKYATKLRDDQIAAKKDYAILTTTAFPPKADGQVVFHENLIFCHPNRTVAVTRIVRHFIIRLSMLSDAGKNTDGKQRALFSLFTSGEGRELLLAASEDIPKLRELDKKLLRQARKHVEDSDEVLKSQAQKFDDIIAAMDRIIRGDDDAAF